MKRLWILRHAKSSWDHAGLADYARPLAPRGRKAAKRIARWADANGVRPELVLCSTAVRAQSTLDLVRPGLGGPEERVEQGLYHASTDDILELVATTDDTVTEVLLIGHNEGIGELAESLAGSGRAADLAALHAKYPTGTLATLRAPAGRWSGLAPRSAELLSFVRPRDLLPE